MKIPPIPFNPLAPEELRKTLLEIKNLEGVAVADTTDVSDTATQLNELIASLRSIGIIKE